LSSDKPLVALVGRPNVGKSTLFNRLVGRPLAVVEDEPGTTRDIVYGDMVWGEYHLTLVDTGGLEPLSTSDLTGRVRLQAEAAIRNADVVLFLVDARAGITSADEDVAEVLRRSQRPVIVVPNKADNEERANTSAEFYAMGIEPVVPISAFHNTGIGELMAEVLKKLPLPDEQPGEETTQPIKIAIIGRPNAGKSSLLNVLVGYERAIVHDVPGTTRDALDTPLEHAGENILLIDTAGMRRRGRIEKGVESHSVLRAIRAVSRCDVALVVVDGNEGITAQDMHVMGYAEQTGKGIVLVINKMDLVRGGRPELQQSARSAISFAPYVPILYISAKTGQGVNAVLDTCLRIAKARTQRVPDRELNSIIQKALHSHPPPVRGNRVLKVLYVTQARADSPTFVLFVNDTHLLHFSYERYLENQLRERFGFEGVPMKMAFRGRAARPKE
jgi:GTPase